jgi:hypothetical protein
MNIILVVVLLYVIWFIFWGLYNFVCLQRSISTEKSPAPLNILYFVFTLLSVIIANQISIFIFWLILIYIPLYVLALVTKNRNFGRLGNSIFQMTWLFCMFALIGKNIFLLSLAFAIAHLPIYLVKHLNRYSASIVMLMASIGGIAFSLILTTLTYPANIVIMVALHFSCYFLLRPFDNRYKLHIIN